MYKVITIITIIVVLLSTPAQAYYVAPYGTASGDGSADSPKTLAWALASAPSGSTVWLIPGVYSGAWVASAPGVTYRSEVGTRAKLDGNLTIQAADTTWRDLEITNTSWLTRTGTTMPQVNTYVGVFAPRVSLLNNYIHDLGGGIYAFNGSGGASADLVVRGNLIYNNGWQDTPNVRSAHGHNLYAQNDDAGRKTIAGNIFANPYSLNVQFYGSSGPSAQLRHFDLLGNTFANGDVLLGGGNPLRDVHARGNRLFLGGIGVGYSSQANEDVEVRDNVIGRGLLSMSWVREPTVIGNTVLGTNSEVVVYRPYAGVITPTWNLNTYYRTDGTATAFNYNPEANKTLAAWQVRTGFDISSTIQLSTPTSNWISVQPNADDPQRATITIYNWTGVSSVSVAVPGLTAGASYKLVNAQNPAQVLTFVAGAMLTIPTAGWTVATPYGAAQPFKGAAAPQFMVFLVEPGG